MRNLQSLDNRCDLIIGPEYEAVFPYEPAYKTERKEPQPLDFFAYAEWLARFMAKRCYDNNIPNIGEIFERQSRNPQVISAVAKDLRQIYQEEGTLC